MPSICGHKEKVELRARYEKSTKCYWLTTNYGISDKSADLMSSAFEYNELEMEMR